MTTFHSSVNLHDDLAAGRFLNIMDINWPYHTETALYIYIYIWDVLANIPDITFSVTPSCRQAGRTACRISKNCLYRSIERSTVLSTTNGTGLVPLDNWEPMALLVGLGLVTWHIPTSSRQDGRWKWKMESVKMHGLNDYIQSPSISL